MIHTPGPWHRYGDGSGIAGPDGQPIAVVAHEGATWEANAQLIGAAPAMAALLVRWSKQGLLPELAQETRDVLRDAGVLP